MCIIFVATYTIVALYNLSAYLLSDGKHKNCLRVYGVYMGRLVSVIVFIFNYKAYLKYLSISSMEDGMHTYAHRTGTGLVCGVITDP